MKESRIVLCNPPFEEFPQDEPAADYPGLKSIYKPVELLYRVLEDLPSNGMLGFVLPRNIIDGVGYRDVRKRLPVGSITCSVVRDSRPRLLGLACRERVTVGHSTAGRPWPTTVSYSEVLIETNGNSCHFTDARTNVAQREPREIANSLIVPVLAEVWDYLGSHTKLGSLDDAQGSPVDRF